ncbi:MAG: TlpA disulfide reductase family protein [Myxococcota bacterium]|jgi:thiol-disulfide isomerase/thioredoxin|nr:TlpA disulfide reductase family protein [Myxococcota bacterium]
MDRGSRGAEASIDAQREALPPSNPAAWDAPATLPALSPLRWAVLLCAVVLFAAWAWPSRHDDAELLRWAASWDADWIGRRAEPLVFRDLEGRRLGLEQFRGRFVLLALFASWCPPCRDEFPSLLRAREALKEQAPELEWVLLSWDHDMMALRSFLDEMGVGPELRVGLDPEGELSRQLGTRLLPETYLLDRDGRLLFRIQNTRQWDAPEQLAMLRRLLLR